MAKALRGASGVVWCGELHGNGRLHRGRRGSLARAAPPTGTGGLVRPTTHRAARGGAGWGLLSRQELGGRGPRGTAEGAGYRPRVGGRLRGPRRPGLAQGPASEVTDRLGGPGGAQHGRGGSEVQDRCTMVWSHCQPKKLGGFP